MLLFFDQYLEFEIFMINSCNFKRDNGTYDEKCIEGDGSNE
jgi:hypothetical protein